MTYAQSDCSRKRALFKTTRIFFLDLHDEKGMLPLQCYSRRGIASQGNNNSKAFEDSLGISRPRFQRSKEMRGQFFSPRTAYQLHRLVKVQCWLAGIGRPSDENCGASITLSRRSQTHPRREPRMRSPQMHGRKIKAAEHEPGINDKRNHRFPEQQ